jgi:AbrB family looped-hinge helix DNA binding protein
MQKATTENQYTIAIGTKGRLILPTALQRHANLHEGEKVVITLAKDGTLTIVPLRACAKACEGMFSHLAPGVSLADELIAERREEAEKEAEEFGL